MIPSTIGVDISKDFLDVHCPLDGVSKRFENTKAGHKELIRWLRKTPIARIVYEPTGPYHRSFEQALAKTELPLVKINARRGAAFCRGNGQAGEN